MGVAMPLPLDLIAESFPGAHLLAGTLAPRTCSEYLSDASHYFAFCAYDPARILNPQSLEAWRQHMVVRTELSANTINRRLHAIKTLVRLCADGDSWDDVALTFARHGQPVRGRTLQSRFKPRPKPLTPDEVRQLCRAPSPLTLRGVRDRALLHTLASSGCRLNEVLTLGESALVHGRACGVWVWGKGQHERRLAPLSHEAAEWIARWLTLRATAVPEGYIFTSFTARGRPLERRMSPTGARLRLKHWGATIGRGDCSPHDLRRFVGTQLTQKAGIRQAQRALGHASIETTARHYVLDELTPRLTEGLY